MHIIIGHRVEMYTHAVAEHWLCSPPWSLRTEMARVWSSEEKRQLTASFIPCRTPPPSLSVSLQPPPLSPPPPSAGNSADGHKQQNVQYMYTCTCTCTCVHNDIHVHGSHLYSSTVQHFIHSQCAHTLYMYRLL